MAFFTKQPSWRASILELQPTESHHFPYEDKDYIYSLLCGSVRKAAPLSIFETEITQILVDGAPIQVIEVKRKN